ncbi:MAG: hypothetical protein AMJ94_00540 [Deltaproteobacteria bacterium SM23_61]|nr:MAG: hypothetical protein AMJ94_00540 [Deltaproteobacteria bacterium SM23_61]
MNGFIRKPKWNQKFMKWIAMIPWAALLIFGSGVAGWETTGGQEDFLPSFGTGTIEVRLYSDYFCSPCRDMEPDLEPLLLDLVKDGAVHLTFIDVPASEHTVLYVRYFLSALGQKNDFDSALHTRRVLFEAARQRMVDKDQLVNLLTEKEIALKPVDVNPVFSLWNRYLQEDQIRSTPSCVIVHGDQKATHVGRLEVIRALEILRDNFGKTPAGSSKDENAAKGKKDKD